MRMDNEYILEDPNSFRVYRQPEIALELARETKDSRGNRIFLFDWSGLTPSGLTNLILVWGATYVDPQSETGKLKFWLGRWPTKYVQMGSFQIPVVEDLGPPRWIVLQWRSPEFLAKGKRYGELARRDPETGAYLLREFPREGVYDHYWTCATAPRRGFPDGRFRQFDAQILEVVKHMWRREMHRDDREAEMMRLESLERTTAAQKEDKAWGLPPRKKEEAHVS